MASTTFKVIQGHRLRNRQVAQLWQRDRATGVCCAYVWKVRYTVVRSCYTSVRPALHRTSADVAKSAFCERVGHFRRIFHMEGASSTNHCWCQKTRVIALSCGIKIFALHHLVLSQYTHLTDGQTELRHQYRARALHYMQSRGENRI